MERPFGLVAACILASATLGPLHAATDLAPGPGDTRLHLESCTKWSEQNGSFGFTNDCSEPVTLIFVELDGLIVANGMTPVAHCQHVAIYQPREQVAA